MATAALLNNAAHLTTPAKKKKKIKKNLLRAFAGVKSVAGVLQKKKKKNPWI